MFRRASVPIGIVSLAMVFVLGSFSSEIETAPSVGPPTVDQTARSPATAPLPSSAGGASFWWLEPHPPIGGEVDFDQCPDTAANALPCIWGEPGTVTGAMAGADGWRHLVALYFEPEDIEQALDIIRCESGGNPSAANPTSSARGLFQHLGSVWDERAADAGLPGADILDPEDNIAVAAWLVYEGGGWSHWNASGHCW